MTCLVLSYVFFTSCEKSEDTKILNTEVISKDITSNLTLKNNVNGVDYIIQGCIELKASAILTIEAGTTIAFTQNSCLEVHEFAAIKAIGTEEIRPATFGIFYDDLDKPKEGGTGHTMNVCIQNNIPILTKRYGSSG